MAGTDEERLIQLLQSLGATDEDLARTPEHQRSALALELALRDGRPPKTLAEAAAQTGVPAENLLRVWRALGFPAAQQPGFRMPASLVEAEGVLAVAPQLIGEEAALGLVRVVGAATSRIADAVVDAFRVGVELPELDRGVPYADVVAGFVAIAQSAFPALEATVCAALRAHVVRVAGTAWIQDFGQAAASRELAVGFADLVGYTALSRTLSPTELARLLRRFEEAATNAVDAHGARVVKQIGDEVMFVAESASSGAATAHALADVFAASDLPPVRVGVAYGSVLTQSGDYYGEVVNRAARLVALANPGTAVVSDSVATALDGKTFGLERLPAQALKGFHAPAVTYRLLPL